MVSLINQSLLLLHKRDWNSQTFWTSAPPENFDIRVVDSAPCEKEKNIHGKEPCVFSKLFQEYTTEEKNASQNALYQAGHTDIAPSPAERTMSRPVGLGPLRLEVVEDCLQPSEWEAQSIEPTKGSQVHPVPFKEGCPPAPARRREESV